MPSARFTLDSNVLVYAADNRDPARQAVCIEIIGRAARRDCALTPQALAEFFHAATRKGIVPRADAARQVRAWATIFPVTPGAGAAALHAAVEESVAGRLQFYDALLLATAAEAGCVAVISEDMHPGAGLGGIRVLAPFAEAGGMAAEVQALL